MPLISSICAGLGGIFLGHPGSMIVSTFLVFLTLLLSCFAFNTVALNGINQYIYALKWIESGLFESNWSFTFDTLTVVMLVVVTSISTIVHIYSTDYMKHDLHVPRFMSYLSLFTFFMIILVTGDNFMVLFVGWEGVGLCSFLLINFWFTRIQANKAAMKAMIMNRIGDIGLALGLFTAFSFFKAVNYEVIFSLIPYYTFNSFFCIFTSVNIIDAICFFLFIGAMGKSAQLGLHSWLPDAMEGPTPVSALIHAATMVTAGIFLLVRCSPIFEYSLNILNFITIIGSSTSFFAATVALLQNDLKRVIAYSTCSQLGYMIFACGVSNYAGGVFHLSNHAFFKALLFLCAGNVIHGMSNEQDMRRMGGLKRLLPYTFSMFLIGNLALMGFPFLSGFYSKDFILESAYAKYTYSGHFAYWLGSFAAFLTAFYSTRSMYMTFLGEPNGFKKVIENVHESPIRMTLPLGILAFCSIFIGYASKDMFIGLGSDFWGNSIFVHPENLSGVDAEFIPVSKKQAILILSLSGLFWAIYLYSNFYRLLFFLKISDKGFIIYTFLNRKWMFDKVINDFISQKFLKIFYNTTYKTLDKGWFEFVGPTGISYIIKTYSTKTAQLYTGLIFHSSLMMLLGVTFFIVFLNFNILGWFNFDMFDLVIIGLIASFSQVINISSENNEKNFLINLGSSSFRVVMLNSHVNN